MFSFRVKDVDVSHRLDPRPLTAPDVAKHYHAMYEIFYFVSGDACLITERGQCALRPGDVMFIRPGQHHIVALDRETPYERYVLKFSVGFVPEHVIDRFGPDVDFFRANDRVRELMVGLGELFEELDASELYTLINCRINEITVLLSRDTAIYKSFTRDKLVTDMIDYIDEHVVGHLDMAALCEKFGKTRAFLTARFNRVMRSPVMQYVRAKKLIAAHKDILAGARPTDVALKYGFTDYSTFYRAYVKVIGDKPARR